MVTTAEDRIAPERICIDQTVAEPKKSALELLCDEAQIKARVPRSVESFVLEQKLTYRYRVTLRRGERRVGVTFDALFPRERITPALAVCVLFDQAGDARLSFEAWCEKHRRDTDSRRAYAEWQALKNALPKVKRLCGDRLKDFQKAAAR